MLRCLKITFSGLGLHDPSHVGGAFVYRSSLPLGPLPPCTDADTLHLIHGEDRGSSAEGDEDSGNWRALQSQDVSRRKSRARLDSDRTCTLTYLEVSAATSYLQLSNTRLPPGSSLAVFNAISDISHSLTTQWTLPTAPRSSAPLSRPSMNSLWDSRT